MPVYSTFEACGLFLLSLFTDYNLLSQLTEDAANGPGRRAVVKRFAQQQRRALEILIPMTMWHIYKEQDVSVSWGFCLILVIRQTVHGLDEELIMDRIQYLGPVRFAVVHSVPVVAVYIFYWIQVAVSTRSPLEVLVQAMLFMLPRILGVVVDARKAWAAKRGRTGRLLLIGSLSTTVPEGSEV
ncbi:hypothetical protein CPC08DRAFT_393998 [Agrocybe pediades]|nr:hypothetical protein CPC08DRAFT_393998 [Agrocybe pediades]